MKVVPPSVELSAFSCPHCDAFTSHTWARLFAKPLPNDGKTPLIPDEDLMAHVRKSSEITPDVKEYFEKLYKGMCSGLPYYEANETSEYVNVEVHNLWVSRCYNCQRIAVWVHDKLVYPPKKIGVQPNPDLPEDIKRDFEEAREIADQSPRGAVALLRLAIQKLCAHLGESGRNIDQDIAALVKKGLNPTVQQALDVVRVIGNEAVHPGTIDLRDDRSTAQRLFELVNLVADQMITHPKSVREMYSKLPESKLKAIAERNR